MENYPFVSVIIPTYRDWPQLERCVNALRSQTYPRNRYEVIVINNDPNSEHPTDNFEDVVLLSEHKVGSYAARNKGLQYSKGPVIAFTDSDCTPKDNWISEGIIYLEDNPDISFVGGRVELTYVSDRKTAIEIYEKAFAFPQHEINRGRNYSVTANMFAHKSAFKHVGLFDENLFSGGDREWGLRATYKGLIIGYADSAVVFHPARSSMKELFEKRIRVTGGQYISTKSTINRLLIIVFGLFPPLKPFTNILKNKNLTTKEKAIAFSISYILRIIRSVNFLLMFLGLSKPTRS